MILIDIGGAEYWNFHPTKAGYADKFARSEKLMRQWNELDAKFLLTADRGNCLTDTARKAIAMRLLLHTGIRIGNEESAEGYWTTPHPNSKSVSKFVHTYGLTTLKPEHVTFSPRRVLLNFTGKRSVENSFTVASTSLRRQLKKVWEYADVTLLDLDYSDMLPFMRRTVGHQFLIKDFRTMKANMVAQEYLRDVLMYRDLLTTRKGFKEEEKEVCQAVASKLSNTPGVCKKSYIDPAFWEFMEETRF